MEIEDIFNTDTIVANTTAAYSSAIAIIRISGTEAFEITAKCLV